MIVPPIVPVIGWVSQAAHAISSAEKRDRHSLGSIIADACEKCKSPGDYGCFAVFSHAWYCGEFTY